MTCPFCLRPTTPLTEPPCCAGMADVRAWSVGLNEPSTEPVVAIETAKPQMKMDITYTATFEDGSSFVLNPPKKEEPR